MFTKTVQLTMSSHVYRIPQKPIYDLQVDSAISFINKHYCMWFYILNELVEMKTLCIF
jgi:hypothetical protein